MNSIDDVEAMDGNKEYRLKSCKKERGVFTNVEGL